MPHNTPSFWYPSKQEQDSPPFKMQALKPLSWLYGAGFNIHQSLSGTQKVDIPVICIGNLSAGGTGKTPTCISFLNMLRECGLANNPYFLLRGYGGAERGPVIVDPMRHTAWDVGDEPLILAKHAPTVISADRVAGAKLGLKHGADMIVMDDGLQNPGIHKDVKIIVINGEMGFGNGYMMPAGPLREPLDSGLKKADAFLLIGQDKTNARALLPDGVPVFEAALKADENNLPDKTQKYLAFAGLGYPKKFFNFLRDDLGYEIVDSVAFADHYPYDRNDLKALRSRAKAQGAVLMTTDKDYLRLPKGYKKDVFTLPVSMQFSDRDALIAFMRGAL